MVKRKKKREAFKPDLMGEIDQNLAWLFIIFIGILPLLVRFKAIDFTAPRIVAPLLNSGMQTDMFSYYKWVFLLCIGLIALLFLLFKMLAYHYELRASYINVPLLFLVFCMVLSFVTAQYKSLALVGMYDMYNGALTYLGYFALLLVAANTVFREWFRKYVTIALGAFTVINMIIILFEFLGHNLAKYPAILSLIIPSNLQAYVQGSLDSTLNHPNYVSGLSVALFTFFLTYALLENRLKHWLLYLFFSIASFVLMLASLSSSGFVSLLIISPLVIAVAFLSWDKKQTIIKAGVTIALCLAVFLIMNAYNPAVSNQTIGIMEQALRLDNRAPQTSLLARSKVTNAALVTSRSISPSRGSSSSNVTQTVPESDLFKLPAAGWSALTGRTYIWQETLKLIEKRPILGYGQDTLAYYFPQNDINKIAGIDSYDTLITKPHNFYLAMAFGSGIPALLSMLALFMMHFYYTSRHLLKAERNQAIIFPAALFLFFCGFTVQWLVNDSVIGSAGIFWTLLGVGVSLNLRHPEC